jgi:cell division protein FtsI (penicillin-binding protein 3)/stage V sporulation protein D (sporulation-specific penicillin-binding protein)
MGSYKLRVRLLIAPFLLIALVMIGKLYFLQIVHGGEYARSANKSALNPQAGVFSRGTIYFTENNGTSIAAATLRSGYILAVKPTEVRNAESVYAALNAIVPLEHDAFIAKATKEGDPYEEVARHVTEAQAKAIRALGKQPSVVLESEQWRYYPGVQLASQVIGFVGYDGDVLNGRYGLEKYYDDALTREGGNLYVNFFAEIFSTAKDFFGDAESTDGDLITTIEPTVELALERELQGIADQYHPKKVGGIIMNPKTGEIYAMASYPTFDLNEYGSADPEWFKNPMVEERYEMGSIIKPLTMAAGLDSGTVTANTTYNDKGFVKSDTATIYNYDKKGRGVVPMQEVLNQSLNTGVSFVVDKMGNTLFSNYMKGYGLGEETGIDLPGEIPGDIKNLDAPRKLEHFTASFGQGIAITPIETVRALASLGNGGFLVTPHVVKAIRNDSGVVRELAQPEPKRVLSEATSREISRMLTVVVDKALAKGGIKIEHTSVAAKTGTAQIADPVNGGYYDSRYLHSFFGYFPAQDPQFIVFFFALEPQGVQFASETLTQPFHHMTTFLLNYYNVAPDR